MRTTVFTLFGLAVTVAILMGLHGTSALPVSLVTGVSHGLGCAAQGSNQTACSAIPGCEYCFANATWSPAVSGGCYNKTAGGSCCADPDGDDCDGRFAICTAQQKCAMPMWECEYAGSPTCIPKADTACQNRHTVTACTASQQCCLGAGVSTSFCCDKGTTCCTGSSPFGGDTCCSPDETCNQTSSGGKCVKSA